MQMAFVCVVGISFKYKSVDIVDFTFLDLYIWASLVNALYVRWDLWNILRISSLSVAGINILLRYSYRIWCFVFVCGLYVNVAIISDIYTLLSLVLFNMDSIGF
jgi:hypothetical protein